MTEKSEKLTWRSRRWLFGRMRGALSEDASLVFSRSNVHSVATSSEGRNTKRKGQLTRLRKSQLDE